MTKEEAVALFESYCMRFERYTTEHPEGEFAHWRKIQPFVRAEFDAESLAAFLTYVLEQRHGAQPR